MAQGTRLLRQLPSRLVFTPSCQRSCAISHAPTAHLWLFGRARHYLAHGRTNAVTWSPHPIRCSDHCSDHSATSCRRQPHPNAAHTVRHSGTMSTVLVLCYAVSNCVVTFSAASVVDLCRPKLTGQSTPCQSLERTRTWLRCPLVSWRP
jgi:hypothetical protein